jgi:hypothetical protein
MKTIKEYEFKAERHGKKFTVQQSGFNQADAKKRIKAKEPDMKIGKQVKTFSYPHLEGGKKV